MSPRSKVAEATCGARPITSSECAGSWNDNRRSLAEWSGGAFDYSTRFVASKAFGANSKVGLAARCAHPVTGLGHRCSDSRGRGGGGAGTWFGTLALEALMPASEVHGSALARPITGFEGFGGSGCRRWSTSAKAGFRALTAEADGAVGKVVLAALPTCPVTGFGGGRPSVGRSSRAAIATTLPGCEVDSGALGTLPVSWFHRHC